MPRPPFVFSRETERAAIDRATRDPAKRQLLYDIVDVLLRVRETNTVSVTEITPLLRGIEATSEAIWGRAISWFAQLYTFAPHLEPALDQLARHPGAAVRFHLCTSLDEFPKDTALIYLRRFLQDKSTRIRGTVLTIAVKAGYHELIPDFESLLAKETNAERQKDVQQAIALLRGKTFTRDGNQIEKLSDGSIVYDFDTQ